MVVFRTEESVWGNLSRGNHSSLINCCIKMLILTDQDSICACLSCWGQLCLSCWRKGGFCAASMQRLFCSLCSRPVFLYTLPLINSEFFLHFQSRYTFAGSLSRCQKSWIIFLPTKAPPFALLFLVQREECHVVYFYFLLWFSFSNLRSKPQTACLLRSGGIKECPTA